MNIHQAILTHPWADKLGWTLLHSVWQCAAIAVAALCVLAILRRRSANSRYLACCMALATMIAAPVATFVAIQDAPLTPASTPAASTTAPHGLPTRAAGSHDSFDTANVDGAIVATDPVYAVGRDSSPMERFIAKIETLLPWLAAAWLAGVGAFSLRLTVGWLRARRLATVGCEPLDDHWSGRIRELAKRMGVSKTVRTVESALVHVPMVIGHFKPALLLPASLLTSLTVEQVEMILAHELAHIRRHDYLVNLVQSMAEILLFYHPAAWWVGRQIRAEREHCCDDSAAELFGDPQSYARTLITFAEHAATSPTMAVAASGGSLLYRVRRLIQSPQPKPDRRSGGLAVAAILLVMTGVGAGVHAAKNTPAVAPEPTTQPAAKPQSTTQPKPKAGKPVRAVVAGVTCEEILAGGDEAKRYFLITPTGEAPAEGYRLLVVLPGGDGGADFNPFVQRILKHALPAGYIVAQPIAKEWWPGQFERIVWPSSRNRTRGMKFTTGQFIDAVVKDVKTRHKIDPRYVFTLGWSSGGPGVYAASLGDAKTVTGTFAAMSVFKPRQLPPLIKAAGHAYYILHSPQDFIPMAMPRMAEKNLRRAGATTTLATYPGGHGWRNDPYGNIRKGIQWLQTQVERPETQR